MSISPLSGAMGARNIDMVEKLYCTETAKYIYLRA